MSPGSSCLQQMSGQAFWPCFSTDTWKAFFSGLFWSGPANHKLSSWALVLGVSPPPGAVLVLHSLPLEFPLAMAFAEQLLSWKSEDSEGKSEDEPDTVPTSVLLQVVGLLGEAHSPSGLSGGLSCPKEGACEMGEGVTIGSPAGMASCQVTAIEVNRGSRGFQICDLQGISIVLRGGN